MGGIDVKKLTDEELDKLIVEMILKMSPGQRAKAVGMICEAAAEVPEKKEAS